MASHVPILPFLRPLAPPRSSTVRQFLRFSTSPPGKLKNDTISSVMTTPLTSSTENSSLEPPSDSNIETSAFEPSSKPRRQRPAIPTLTVPPAPPPKRILSGYIREAKARQRTQHSPASIVAPSKSKNPKSIPPEARFPTPTPSSTPPTPPDITQLPYFVQRVRPSGQLPIYHDLKAGKTLKQTRIRKISGDARALKKELKEFLGIQKEKDCAVNPVTGHILLKGHWRSQVDGFLVAKGF